MGDFKPWSMGEKPMCCHLVFFLHLPCLIQPLQPLYCFIQPPSLRMAAGGWGNYFFWEWGGRTIRPLAHVPTPSTTTFTLLSHVFQTSQLWSVHSLHGRFFLTQSQSLFIHAHKGVVHAHKGTRRRRSVRFPNGLICGFCVVAAHVAG